MPDQQLGQPASGAGEAPPSVKIDTGSAGGFTETDPPLALARLLGLERLAARSTRRLDEALQRAATHLAAARSDGE